MDLAAILHDAGVRFVSGVPDSVLAPFQHQIAGVPGLTHRVAASEGSAVAIAAGHSLMSGQPACVYMQNSGLPNALNPLMSLFAPEQYGAGLILIVGWRGEPGRDDEPQHRLVGAKTQALLDMVGPPPLHVHRDLPAQDVARHLADAVRSGTGASLLVSRGALPGSGATVPAATGLDRRAALISLLTALPPEALVFTGIGYLSREVMALDAAGLIPPRANLPMVGGMGLASHTALGAALQSPDRPVYCLDGDGAFLMHGMGLAIVAEATCRFRHVVLNNRRHTSVGGFATCAPDANLAVLAAGLGYRHTARIDASGALPDALVALEQTPGPAFLEIICDDTRDAELPRPTQTLPELKSHFLTAAKGG